MNEKDTKQLLDKSIVETSDDFTDELMQRLMDKKMDKKASVWRFAPVFSILIVVVLIFSFTFYKYLKTNPNFYGFTIESNKTPFLLLVTVILFLVLNYMLKLKEDYNISELDK